MTGVSTSISLVPLVLNPNDRLVSSGVVRCRVFLLESKQPLLPLVT
jgi:hypothetical protein